MLGTKRRFFGNIVGHAEGVKDPSSLASWTAEAFDPSLNWERIKELMDMWGGKVVLKGIMEVEDAVKAAVETFTSQFQASGGDAADESES